MATTTPPVYPIAFSGRNARGPWRKVHLAPDVNDGDTLCGLDIVHVAATGAVAITTPAKWPFLDGCTDCRLKANGVTYTGPKWGLEWSD